MVVVVVVACMVPAAAVPRRAACCCCWAVQLLVLEQPLVAAVEGYQQVVVAQPQPLVGLMGGLHDLHGVLNTDMAHEAITPHPTALSVPCS
jgi:hypothetical protein